MMNIKIFFINYVIILNINNYYYNILFNIPKFFWINPDIKSNIVPSFQLKSLNHNLFPIDSINKNLSHSHMMLERINILDLGDKLLQVLLQCIIDYPHILLPLFIIVFTAIINFVSFYYDRINSSLNHINSKIYTLFSIMNLYLFKYINLLRHMLNKKIPFKNRINTHLCNKHKYIKIMGSKIDNLSKLNKLLRYTSPIYRNFIVNPINVETNNPSPLLQINHRFPSWLDQNGNRLVRLQNQIVQIQPFNINTNGYHQIGFYYEGIWIEILPTFETDYVTIGHIYTAEEIVYLRGINTTLDDYANVNLNFEILSERIRVLETLTRDRGLRLVTSEDGNLEVELHTDAELSEHHQELIRINDLTVIRRQEFLFTHRRAILHFYDMPFTPSSLERHRSNLRELVHKYDSLERRLATLYGLWRPNS